MKRRGFLQAGTGLVVGFALPGCTLPVFPKRPVSGYEDALGWIHHEQGRFTLRLPRAEMGQQIATALRQVAADELGVDARSVELVLPTTGDTARVRATVGSESVRDFALPLAQACATLREALARGDTQGQLEAEPLPASSLRAFRRRPEPRAPLPLVHGHEIVTGAPLYVADVRPPALLFGRVLRAPTSPELPSRPVEWNDAAARAVPGFVALVRDERLRQAQAHGLGLVARTPGALDRIEAALSVRWQSKSGGHDGASVARLLDVDTHRARGRLPHEVLDAGRVDEGAAWDVDLRIDIPFAAHAAIEPRGGGAAPGGGRTRGLWGGAAASRAGRWRNSRGARGPRSR